MITRREKHNLLLDLRKFERLTDQNIETHCISIASSEIPMLQQQNLTLALEEWQTFLHYWQGEQAKMPPGMK